MACIALVKESVVAISKFAQQDIDTPNVIGEFVRLLWNQPEAPTPDFTTENDADDATGTQDDFPTTVFPVSRIINGQLNGFLSAEKMAIIGGFCLGNLVSKTGVGPYQYTFTPMDRATDGCESPLFSMLHQIRGGTIADDLYRSNAVAGFLVSLTSGAGRASSQISADIAGIGVRDPDSASGETMPALTSEVFLQSASLAFTSLGDNLVTARRVQSVNWGFTSPIDTERMIFPGAGVDSNGYAVGGRMQFTQRAGVLNYVVDLDESGSEMTKFLAGTTGTVTIAQTNGTSGYSVTFHLVRFTKVRQVASGRYLTYAVECLPLRHASNGLMTLVVDTAVNDILTVSP